MPAKEPFIVPLILTLLAQGFIPPALAGGREPSADEGIRFSCTPLQLQRIKFGMAAYLKSLGIGTAQVVQRLGQGNTSLLFTLNTAKDDSDTLGFKDRLEFALSDEMVLLPGKNGKPRRVKTVSRKEILLTLLQHGRLTEFRGRDCSMEALRNLVGMRQNIVAWSEDLNWVWPDGEYAEWNNKYWHSGTPLPGVRLSAAFGDAFMNQDKYAIGCYTATKLVVAHAILDYYRRVRKDRARARIAEARINFDHEPLADIEPGRMWSFEKDFDPADLARPGKLLQITYGVAPTNFVPGDWVYLLNTDPVSSMKTGYEGSNAIYLGRNKFDDYYNDNGHSYTYREKLNEVYQWRNGVFNRYRDAAKIRNLSGKEFEQLGRLPAEGGLVMDFRVSPDITGTGTPPAIAASPASPNQEHLAGAPFAAEPDAPPSANR